MMDAAPINLEPDNTASGSELPDHLLSKLRISIPGYELLDKIESGGQATVYRAREITSGLTVAIKVLNGGVNAGAAARDRLLRETAALRAMNHPNIVCVVQAGRTPIGLDFIVMNFVDGRPLDSLWMDRTFCAKIAPEPPARLRLFKRICEIVQSAHIKGITHRDLSPSNILITDDGEPHILDFGLASTAFDQLLSASGQPVTLTGQFLGKLKYASPEQARDDRDTIDIRADVYALGVILYQILTDGAFPYEVAGALVDVLNNIINAAPLPPRTLLRNNRRLAVNQPRRKDPRLINETIEAIVFKALKKDPTERYQSAGELAADIDQYLDGRPTTAVIRRRGEGSKAQDNRRRTISFSIISLALITGVLMNARVILNWVGLSTLAVALGANPPPRVAVRPVVARPVPRARVQLGRAPQPSFKVNNKTIAIDAKAPAVKAVRAIPPQSFAPAARSKAVEDFTKTISANKPIDKTALAKMNVGPFRPEFVWWAYYDWALNDRAWWAWNNRNYFELGLWNEWMLNPQFKTLIDSYQAAKSPQVQGFIPAKYANESAAVVYNDSYIQAVYNPVVYTHPAIIVDGSAGTQLGNLIEGAPRLYGNQQQTIDRVDGTVTGLQFISVPAGATPTYQIEVKRDGDLYLFGSKKTSLSDGVQDASKWQHVSATLTGGGIDAVYKRKVTAGESIRMHGVEWSIASDQIELFAPASKAAQAAIHHVAGTLEQMTKNKDGFLKTAPELRDYLEQAKTAADGMMTTLENVNDDKVIDCHYELAKTEQMAGVSAESLKDPELISSEAAFVKQVKELRESLNEVDELRDPSLDGQPGSSSSSPAVASKIQGNPLSANLIGTWSVHNKSTGLDATEIFDADGSCTSRLTNHADIEGKWHLEDNTLEINWENGVRQVFVYSKDGRRMRGRNPDKNYDLEATQTARENDVGERPQSISKTILGQWDFWNAKGWKAVVTFEAGGTCSSGPADGSGTAVQGRWEAKDDTIAVTWNNGVQNVWRVGQAVDEMSIAHIENGVETHIDAKKRP